MTSKIVGGKAGVPPAPLRLIVRKGLFVNIVVFQWVLNYRRCFYFLLIAFWCSCGIFCCLSPSASKGFFFNFCTNMKSPSFLTSPILFVWLWSHPLKIIWIVARERNELITSTRRAFSQNVEFLISFQVARLQDLKLVWFNLRRGFPQALVYLTCGAFTENIHTSSCLNIINADISGSPLLTVLYGYCRHFNHCVINILLGNLWYLFQCWNFGFQVRIKLCLLSSYEWQTDYINGSPLSTCRMMISTVCNQCDLVFRFFYRPSKKVYGELINTWKV